LFSKRGGGKVWGPRYDGIDSDAETQSLAQVCARQWVASVETARRDLAMVPPSRVFEIRYEDLVRDDVALSALVADLDLPDAASILKYHTTQLRSPSGSRFGSLPQDQQTQIMDQIAPTLKTMGY